MLNVDTSLQEEEIFFLQRVRDSCIYHPPKFYLFSACNSNLYVNVKFVKVEY